ncbi:MAG: MoaD/ThiS family protein [Anaerolineaceae bacterium]
MQVTVKLFATLAGLRGDVKSGKPFEVDLPDSATVTDLINILQIPTDEIHIVFINNIIQEPASTLKDGDVVGIFPPVGGG